MKLIEFKIGENKVNIERSILGIETVFVNDLPISKKRTLLGTSHNISVENVKYTIKYTVKNWWKEWTGKPTFELISGKTVISEYRILNATFFSIQFILSLIVFYIIITLFMTFIESAKRGFIFNAQ